MIKKRAKGLRIIFVFVFFALAIRLYFLQIRPSEKVTANYTNHQTEIISDMNYMLFDKNLKDLNNYNKDYVVVIDSKPFKLNNYGEALQGLLAFNFIMKEEVSDFSFDQIMKVPYGKNYYNVSKETFDKVNNIKNVKGVYTYIYDRKDNKEAWSIDGMFSNLDKIEAKENSFDYLLKKEIENNKLPKVNFYRDENTVYSSSSLVNVEENKNIQLTIDKEMQNKVKSTILDKKYENFNNIGVLIMESKTGKIRTITQKDDSSPNINLGMEGIGFEPGSVFKLITYAAALEEGVITPDTTYKCRMRKCKEVNHGKISVKNALNESCNDVFADIGEQIGIEKLLKYAKNLGMYERILGIESENKTEAKGGYRKEDAGVDNIAIGQSMTATPIQMVGAVNTFLNNGVYIKPNIIEGILDSDANIVKEFKEKGEIVFSSLTSGMVKDGMKDVVLYGTGKKAAVDGKNIYGKTGSGTFLENTHCWIVGGFNMDGVDYTMSILVPDVEEDGKNKISGGTIAAPIFGDVVKGLIGKVSN